MDQRQFFADAPSGEGRLMFGVTDGAADDPASKPLAMVTIFEYVLPETRSLNEWAASWHALAKLDGQGEQYRAALQAITDGFVTRNARPGRQNGSALAQVRTNEAALSWIWQLREFGLATDGSLTLRPVWNTPAEQLNNSQTLARFVNENAELIRAKKHVLPAAMRPGASDALRFSWAMPGVDAETTRAFTEGTCNGCHQTHSVVDSAFHISPFRSGRAKVSRFLYDPDHAGNDEVHTRAASFREALGPSCGARP